MTGDMAQDALIGATGFVGGNLRLYRGFSEFYNSGNITSSAGKSFDTVICAAAPASMIEANRAPERDRERIDGIIQHLSRLNARRFVLVSTIAVLSDFGRGMDEETGQFEEKLAYGVNRRRLESFVSERFDDHLILRLPALFGHGLRKNLIFDLMNPVPSMLTAERRDALFAAVPAEISRHLDNLYAFDSATSMWHLDRPALDALDERRQIEAAIEEAGFESLRFTNPASRFQFFDLSLLPDLIDRSAVAGLRLLHVATEPVEAGRIVMALRGRAMPSNGARLHAEDMQTRHAAKFGTEGRYLAHAEEVLARLERFVKGIA